MRMIRCRARFRERDWKKLCLNHLEVEINTIHRHGMYVCNNVCTYFIKQKVLSVCRVFSLFKSKFSLTFLTNPHIILHKNNSFNLTIVICNIDSDSYH